METIITAKLFKNGNSQAVRLPKEFRFEGDEVQIMRKGNQVILKPIAKPFKKTWDEFFSAMPMASGDFMDDVDDPLPDEPRLKW